LTHGYKFSSIVVRQQNKTSAMANVGSRRRIGLTEKSTRNIKENMKTPKYAIP
jgi:hypothetical protein